MVRRSRGGSSVFLKHAETTHGAARADMDRVARVTEGEFDHMRRSEVDLMLIS